jgi:pimeloyl-ACP methyl ester carboxylesterase
LPRLVILYLCTPIVASLALLTRPLAAAPTADAPSPQWAACPQIKDAQCTMLTVPIDPAKPGGATLKLRLARMPTTATGHKRGVLLIIPGGPGVGIEPTLSAAKQQVSEFRRYYDVVTFDPRGVGQSDPIRCDPNAVPKPAAPPAQDPTRAQFRTIMAKNSTFFRTCFALSETLMPHLSATDTAADIERIRRALTPDDGLVAYAGSYGTLYAAMYLERYGSHVKALVLDGVVDHSVDQPTDITRAILAMNETFQHMSAWCDRTAGCALHRKNVGAAYDAAVAKAPIVRLLVALMLAAGQDPHVGWPAITKMLAEVSRGDMTAIDAFTKAAAEARGSGSQDAQITAGEGGLYAGVVCADYGPVNDYDAFVKAGQTAVREAPRFAWRYWDWTPIAHMGPGAADCTGWSRPATNPPHVLHVGWHRNVMVANPARDPSTALPNALAVHQEIPGSVLLIADVDGHQTLVRSQCSYDAMEKFLTGPKSVPATILCHH